MKSGCFVHCATCYQNSHCIRHSRQEDPQGEASVVVSPENWIQVFGKSGSDFPQQFQAAMSNLANVGFTFGGRHFAGHGIYVKQGTGSMRFVLKEYSIN
jgi:hypothetical protein